MRYPEIEVSPKILNFGETRLGWKSERTITIRNTGKVDLEVSNIVLPGEFSVTPEAPLTIGSVAEEKVRVEFVPTGLEETGNALYMEIQSNDSKRPSVYVRLRGEVLPAEAMQFAHIGPPNVKQGSTATVVLYGDRFPLEQFLLTIDFGPGISVTDIRTVSPTNMEVAIEIAKDAEVGKRDVTVFPKSQLGIAPVTLQGKFEVIAREIKPQPVAVKPALMLGVQNVDVVVEGIDFQKDFHYTKVQKPVTVSTGSGKGRQTTTHYEMVDDPETRREVLPTISTNAPGVVIEDMKYESSTLLKARVTVSKDPAICPPGKYDVNVTNPDGEQFVGRGMLVVEALPQGQMMCPHCGGLSASSGKWCDKCGLPLRSSVLSRV